MKYFRTNPRHWARPWTPKKLKKLWEHIRKVGGELNKQFESENKRLYKKVGGLNEHTKA